MGKVLLSTITSILLVGFAAAVPAQADPLGSVGQPTKYGDYCGLFRGAERTMTNGAKAFCVQVNNTDVYVWAPERRLVPWDPNKVKASPGQACTNANAMAMDRRTNRTLFCNPTENGRLAGNLVYQFLPGNGAVPKPVSWPVIGTKCVREQLNDLRYTRDNKPTVCVFTGARGDYKWVMTANVDPAQRNRGDRCTGQYSVARTPQGKAVMCSQGRWVFGP